MSPQVQATNQVMVAEYTRYDDAERAVDYLSDRKYPVEHLTVVGCDLRLVETVLARLTWGRAAIGGLATGAWIGLFVGLLLAIWTDSTSSSLAVIVGSTVYGAIFGAVFSLGAYAMTGGRHDYLSRSQIVPSKYELLADADFAERARSTLSDLH
jgi:hypothetical protein